MGCTSSKVSELNDTNHSLLATTEQPIPVQQPQFNQIVSSDLSVFQNFNPPQVSKLYCCNIKQCDAIKRLLYSLFYYDLLKVDDNINYQKLSCNFMDNIYKQQIYDDFYHLTKYHQSEMQSVMDFAISKYNISKCNLTTCAHSNRHYRLVDAKSNDDCQYFDLYQETMDSLHFYVFHLAEGGMRWSNNCVDQCEVRTTSRSPYFDASFDRICTHINNSRNKTSRFKRLNSNKFNISDKYVQDNTNAESFSSVIDVGNYIQIKQSYVPDLQFGNKGDATFLDWIHSELLKHHSLELIQSLLEIMNGNDYDTDALDMDLEIFQSDDSSNLSKLLTDSEEAIALAKIFEKAQGFVHCSFLTCLTCLKQLQSTQGRSHLVFIGGIVDMMIVDIEFTLAI